MKEIQSKKRVLLIDGEIDRRERLAEVLQSVYHVTSALDGEMAVDILKSDYDFAAILLQCRLFEYSGFDVLGFLHTNRMLLSIPVIAMGEKSDELKALSLGAVSFIELPKEPYLICYQMQNLVRLIQSDRDCDTLTGVLQWAPFLKRAAEYLEQSGQMEDTSRWGMVFINVDRFKVFNDLFGRSAGDQLLRNLAARLTVMKGAACVGRVGGDRFVMLCRMEELELSRFGHIAGELMRRLRLKYALHICCGIYEIEDITMPVGEICDRAQIAQQTISGKEGKGVAFYGEELRESLCWEQEVVSQMYEALEQGQFEVYLQPIYSLSAGAPVSAEALVRWVHPQRGIIPPGHFIPIFERNGFITKLDKYVWERVFQYLAEFQAAGYDLRISANMSRMDIYNMDVCGQLADLAKKYGVPPASFQIEVTESAYMDDPHQLVDTTRRFNAAGFAVMIDDFGSGYSSLNMLMDMPVSTLKLDMSFVRGVGSDERTNCVVTSILRMAKWLEMNVVAEGVESQTHVDYLRAIGCDRVQGFYFSRPIPKAEFVQLLERYSSQPLCEKPLVYDKSADTQVVWAAVTAYDRMLEGRMDAAALYEQSGGTVEILCVNDSYYRLMESSPDRLAKSSQDAMAWVMEEDQALLSQALDTAAETGERQELVIRRYMNATRAKNLMVSVCYLGRKDSRRLFLMILRDISRMDLRLPPEQGAASKPVEDCAGGGDGERPKVLIVEDNIVNRMVLQKMLSPDYEVVEASNGKKGLELLRSVKNIQAVLLDIIMPVMDGCEFLQAKRQDAAVKDIPVLVLSQSDNNDSQKQVLKLGANGFVRKPYDPERLMDLLKTLIATKKA